MLRFRAPSLIRSAACLLALALALPALQAANAAPAGHPSGTPQWLTVDAATHTLRLTLIAGYTDANHGDNFDGYADGKMILSVPAGYHITVIFRNRSNVPHSALVTSDSARATNGHFPPAFPGAHSPHAIRGVAQGKTQRFSFTATAAGTYALVSAVPGQAAAGMWAVLRVTDGGAPSLTFLLH